MTDPTVPSDALSFDTVSFETITATATIQFTFGRRFRDGRWREVSIDSAGGEIVSDPVTTPRLQADQSPSAAAISSFKDSVFGAIIAGDPIRLPPDSHLYLSHRTLNFSFGVQWSYQKWDQVMIYDDGYVVIEPREKHHTNYVHDDATDEAVQVFMHYFRGHYRDCPQCLPDGISKYVP